MRFAIVFLSAFAAYAQSEPVLRSSQSDAPVPKPVPPLVQAAAPLTSQPAMEPE
jgi:hypothetical protein